MLPLVEAVLLVGVALDTALEAFLIPLDLEDTLLFVAFEATAALFVDVLGLLSTLALFLLEEDPLLLLEREEPLLLLVDDPLLLLEPEEPLLLLVEEPLLLEELLLVPLEFLEVLDEEPLLIVEDLLVGVPLEELLLLVEDELLVKRLDLLLDVMPEFLEFTVLLLLL